MTIFLKFCYKCNSNIEFGYIQSFLHQQVCLNCGNKIRPILKSHLVDKLNK